MLTRINIGIFGAVNVGKSTLMNIITQQTSSLVDKKPGTTADIKKELIELHNIGPVKLFDTAGINEKGILGKKKKIKTILALKESDLILLIIDPFNPIDLKYAKEILNLAKIYKKSYFVIYNIFENKKRYYEVRKTQEVIQSIERKLENNAPKLIVDLSKSNTAKIIAFIEDNFQMNKQESEFLPHLKVGDTVFLNIPMDEETPRNRLLRPQAYVQENFLRRYIATFAYRMDLIKARNPNKKQQEQEKKRFQKTIKLLQEQNLKLLITDSQAIDIIHPWTRGLEITTFSIIMADIVSRGKLNLFVEGLKVLKSLKKGDKILIAEACNHNRIKEDIGTVQLPKKLNFIYGKDNIIIEHAFGREVDFLDLQKYKLIIHCGGCMLDQQKMQSRIIDLMQAKIPITNYGIILSYFQSPQTLRRVLKPFGLCLED
ncbi:MAG: hypothetical protein AMS24_03225 [Chlamydiae bacterium SM23_39]|nr:MAG: hypothetical protein AMS24_03225 [Chlamydiae bacterium SM23_39]